mgnify:CR=1 FL=1
MEQEFEESRGVDVVGPATKPKKGQELYFILKVLVGSRAHGLSTETSDYDYRGVFVQPTETILSLGGKVQTTLCASSVAVNALTVRAFRRTLSGPAGTVKVVPAGVARA